MAAASSRGGVTGLLPLAEHPETPSPPPSFPCPISPAKQPTPPPSPALLHIRCQRTYSCLRRPLQGAHAPGLSAASQGGRPGWQQPSTAPAQHALLFTHQTGRVVGVSPFRATSRGHAASAQAHAASAPDDRCRPRLRPLLSLAIHGSLMGLGLHGTRFWRASLRSDSERVACGWRNVGSIPHTCVEQMDCTSSHYDRALWACRACHHQCTFAVQG